MKFGRNFGRTSFELHFTMYEDCRHVIILTFSPYN
jgi:hypothetical protein